MTTIGGMVFLLACVFGSYVAGGRQHRAVIDALPFEMLTIGGAAIGAFLMANSMRDVKHVAGGFGKVLKGAPLQEGRLRRAAQPAVFLRPPRQTKGAIALEPHIEKPEESTPSPKFPKILQDHFAVDVICDNLRMMGMNADDPHQIEDVMEAQLKKTLHEELHRAHALQSMADAPAGAGHRRRRARRHQDHGAASPAAGGPGRHDRRRAGRHLPGRAAGLWHGRPHGRAAEGRGRGGGEYYEIIRAVLVAHLHGNAPQVAVETGRKMAPTALMPSFQELEEALQDLQIA